MKIALQQLLEKNACSEARSWFLEMCGGEETAEFDWTPAAQGLALADRTARQWLGWAWQNGVLPMWSMRDSDLSDSDLSDSDLSDSDLRGADLRGTNLYGTDLRGTNLRGANLPEERPF